jgi:hypothetical protein
VLGATTEPDVAPEPARTDVADLAGTRRGWVVLSNVTSSLEGLAWMVAIIHSLVSVVTGDDQYFLKCGQVTGDGRLVKPWTAAWIIVLKIPLRFLNNLEFRL